ncbi:hypothetical protein I3843_15G130000 [Carya illinoinensis]|uniref:Uncharacterized protein n=1 Tax=Carya illinoinensis TaxID=32201 RepID=A0A8T1N7R9_CARIL|nr:hypothetical protein I3760_15G134100 [Carya illinoinensis]KAG6627766.1 hypothetical protein CIPAW_15G151900 [Carya illinoinensis]KAG7944973.1 hypothetical protein I3843_15G130000 [Carya illinoinensis]
MATMTVEISSKETIKPSSPTPQHLRNHNLSFIDQLAPNISSQLKKSLEQTLNRFYPLAGTIKEDNFVDCNDNGVEFSEALVGGQLSDVLQQFDTEILNQFLPFEANTNGIGLGSRSEVLLAIQYNIFDCGGVAIGACVSHRIADGTSATTFLNAWSATSRGDIEAIVPKFDAASFFPKKDMPWYKRDNLLTKEKVVTRRLLFNKSSIATLREKVSTVEGSQVKFPTRVQTVSALIWGRLMAIFKAKPASIAARLFVANHVVNLRERMIPPHANAFLWQYLIMKIDLEDDDSKCILVSKLDKAIKGVNDDYVKQLQSDALLDLLKKGFEQFSSGGMESYNFSSWFRFPFYEIDFGWGKPTWVCCSSVPFKNSIILMSTKDGHGIEAYVTILEEDSVIFDNDQELLPFVSGTVHD